MPTTHWVDLFLTILWKKYGIFWSQLELSNNQLMGENVAYWARSAFKIFVLFCWEAMNLLVRTQICRSWKDCVFLYLKSFCPLYHIAILHYISLPTIKRTVVFERQSFFKGNAESNWLVDSYCKKNGLKLLTTTYHDGSIHHSQDHHDPVGALPTVFGQLTNLRDLLIRW